MGALRLQHRIVIPFIVIAVVTTAGAAYVALSVTSTALESRVRSQLLSATAAVSRSDLALNPAILKTLEPIIGAHIVTFGADGAILAGSLPAERAGMLAAVREAALSSPSAEAGQVRIVRLNCGAPCLLAFKAVEGRSGTIVALLAETSELTAATRAVARTIVAAAVLSVIVMLVVSQVIARRVTAPLDRLVRFTRELSPEGARPRAIAGADEVGRLAGAFNEMLDRLDESRSALVRSEKLALAGLLAARVAHDIRNPLSSIKMQSQLLRARLGRDPDDQAAFAAVLHDIDQVESVIRDLLELARPGELARQPVALNDVVSEAVKQRADQFAYQKIAVVTELAADLPPVLLDAKRFKQALLNLFANAADAMPTGGRLTVRTAALGADAVEVIVCDDGLGIDPAVRARLFDPFISTKRDGVGLGLVNVKAVVEAHAGTITLEPSEPKGTRARLRLPVHAGASASEATLATV